MKRLLLIFIVVLLFTTECFAGCTESPSGTHTADTCSRADVVTCITNATDGESVIIPANECTWDSQIQFSQPLNITGAGIDVTIINVNHSNHAFRLDADSSTPFTISGMTIQGTTAGVGNGVRLTSSPKDFRITDIKFYKLLGAITVYGYANGVIDNNQFISGKGHEIEVLGDCDTIWDLTPAMGSANAVFIEDNSFQLLAVDFDGAYQRVGNEIVSGNWGGYYVYRYNDVLAESEPGNIQMSSVADAHGICSNDGGTCTPNRGLYAAEIYNNTYDIADCYQIYHFRGGRGAVYDNDYTDVNALCDKILMDNYRSHSAAYVTAQCHADAQPDCVADEGYICDDQINNFYIWDDTTIAVEQDDLVPTHVQVARDFFISELSYTPYTYPHPLNDTCVPTTCIAEGYDCGTPDDGCGTPLSCGSCSGTCTNYVCIVSTSRPSPNTYCQ